MTDKETQRLMREEQKAFGIQSGFKVYSPADFAGMAQQSSARQDGDDKEFWFRENWIKTGPFCLRTLWDQGQPIYVAPSGKTIIYYTFFNIGAFNYVAVFLNDGTATQVDTASGVQTAISTVPNTFYNSGVSSQIPVATSWGGNYLLIANNFSSSNYWVWDGTDLHSSGTLAPEVTLINPGSNYSSAPTVTAYGGSGTGATFQATVQNGSVVSVVMTNPGSGYGINDQPQLYFTGGGSDDGIELLAVLGTTSVKSVIITSPGNGYVSGTYALGFSGGGGTGAAGTYTVDLSGTVVSTNITASGTGYTGTPTVSFPSGGGSAASGVATLAAGGVASVTVVHGGTNLTGTPTISIVGGGGTGAEFTAILSGGTITSVTRVKGGNGYTSTPAVVAETGLNNAAAATVTLMPTGISGTSIENFSNRVWIGHPAQPAGIVGNGVKQTGGVFNISAPGSFTDFSQADGGLTFTNSDAFLRYQYVNFKQANGYLYAFGDSSVSVISNVQTSGNPVVTTLNYQNTDPQTGLVWRDSLTSYQRTILFANPFGVFGLYGGSITKISKKLDNIFQNAVFPSSNGITPTSAVANIFNSRVFLMNMTITDPFTEQSRTVMVSWDESDWFISSQYSTLTFIASQEINSDMIAWGTDGNSLFPLFTTPSNTLQKKLSTKLYGQDNFLIQKQPMGIYIQAQDLSPSRNGIAIDSLTIDAEHGSYHVPSIPSFPVNSGPPYYPVLSMGSGDVMGCNIGATMIISSQDMSIQFFGIGYIEVGSIAQSSTPIEGQIETE